MSVDRRLRVLAAATLMIASGIAVPRAVQAQPGSPASVRAPQLPNFVVVLTDDQRFDTLWAMPNVKRLLVRHGVTFSNAFVVNPLCCPSRASILTGRYSHGTGVYDDTPTLGIDAFDPSSTIATWLHGRGYTTDLVGKYLNWNQTPTVPPGWDGWHALETGAESGAYYDYELASGGGWQSYRDTPHDYSTRVMFHLGDSFIRAQTGPFFLYLATSAPHGPAIPAHRDATAFSHLPPARPPSWNEADVSDKPAWVRALPSMSRSRQAVIDDFRIAQYRTLLAVDRGVGKLVATLRDEGALSNTMIVFTSDNGYVWGEHRFKGKLAPYEESIRVPLVIRYPLSTSGGTTSDRLVANIDIAPTLADAAGISAPGADGASLLPLLANPEASGWRTDLLIEHYQNEMPSYCALRAEGSLYVYYASGEQEYYDLISDPWELHNLAGRLAYAGLIQAAQQRLGQLCSPPPPGMTLPF